VDSLKEREVAIEINIMEEREINEVTGKEVVMKDTDYEKVSNKVMKPRKRVAGERGPQFLSNEEFRAKFCTGRYRKNSMTSANDSAK
jgi:hypothetical protein